LQQIEVVAKKREKTGKSIARSLRRQGLIPAVLYGGEAQPLPLAVDPTQLKIALGQENTLINLRIEGQETDAQLSILREVQRDLIKNRILHADLMRISMDKKITIEVPVVLAGQSPDVKEKRGILEHLMRSVQVECLPQDIPQRLEVDISPLTMKEPIHVSDLKVPAGVEILEDAEQVIAMISALGAEEAAPVEVAPEVAAAEPELVGRKEGPKEKEKVE
jgi:large subunit ribosomal protein L25